MILVGISGKAESGKTTFANLLKENFKEKGQKVMLINYGDMVKHIACQYYNWSGNKDEEGRTLLQKIGTERGRNIDSLIWIQMVEKIINICSRDYDIAIIADCRFPNELDYWNTNNKRMVKIRIERPYHESRLTNKQKLHISETALDNYNGFDMTIVNTSLDELKEQSKEIANSILLVRNLISF